MDSITRALVETKSVLVSPERPFTLASGRLSPVYVDCRRLISFPKIRSAITKAFAEIATHKIGLKSLDVIAGGETAGIAYAALLAAELDLPMIYVRKKPKGYGRTSQIEGILGSGQRVLLIEDLVTDGGSKLAFKEGIEAAGAVVEHCCTVFEYFSKSAGLNEAKRKLGEAGIELYSLSNWDELLQFMISEGSLTAQQQEQVLSFLKNPDGWQKS
ncbi:orotate phosphoribosyltransferase [Candidatus Acetothermia bacterium]|nr:orotate phosphoribosyltransferase [Candidatus Acetothermia bacterium]MBI3643449.1 orotate phosphoribosyltransferase [Candidatus Acetothermia bacterium]